MTSEPSLTISLMYAAIGASLSGNSVVTPVEAVHTGSLASSESNDCQPNC